MVRFFRCHFLPPSRRVNVTVLAFALLLGFLFGSLCSGFAESHLYSLMRMGAGSPVSIVCLLPVLLLPFLCSALAAYFGLVWLIFPIAFLKAFFFSYLIGHILVLFPNSGSLFAGLFFCADVLSMPVLCWFWLRCTSSGLEKRIWIPVFLTVLGIGFFDCHIVSPFLVSLLS